MKLNHDLQYVVQKEEEILVGATEESENHHSSPAGYYSHLLALVLNTSLNIWRLHKYSLICFVTDNNFRVMIKKVFLVSPLKEAPIAEVMAFTSYQRPTDQMTLYSGIQKEDISEPYFNLMLIHCNIQAATIDCI